MTAPDYPPRHIAFTFCTALRHSIGPHVGPHLPLWQRHLPASLSAPSDGSVREWTTQSSTKFSYNNQQIARAKSRVCDAFAKVDHASDVADARNGGGDPTLQLAVATGTRQVFDAGSRFLSTTLDDEPGTSPELAMAVRKQADSLQELTVGYLDGLPNSAPDQQPALTAMNESTASIRRLCR